MRNRRKTGRIPPQPCHWQVTWDAQLTKGQWAVKWCITGGGREMGLRETGWGVPPDSLPGARVASWKGWKVTNSVDGGVCGGLRFRVEATMMTTGHPHVYRMKDLSSSALYSPPTHNRSLSSSYQPDMHLLIWQPPCVYKHLGQRGWYVLGITLGDSQTRYKFGGSPL